MANSSMSGRHIVQMDTRGRISFPAAYRAVIGETLYISPDTRYKNYLVVRTEEAYNACRDQIMEEGLRNGDYIEEIQEDIRDFCMMTATVVPDKNGRITLPQELIEYAHLTSGKAVVAGMVDFAEIWDAAELEKYEAERRKTRERRRHLMDMERAKYARRKETEVEDDV